MDDLAAFNQERWDALARANIAFARPWLDLDPAVARERLDPEGRMRDPAGKEVLCLACGGGQQSAALALLGARVTVLDLSETMLERDRATARHYGLEIRAVQGDMRDLSGFSDDGFDLVYHAHSINFVPDVTPVYDEVRRVIRPGGQYRMSCNNPFSWGVREDEWDERGYPVRGPYVDGAEWEPGRPNVWPVWDAAGTRAEIDGPREFRHILSTLVNGLIARGFVIDGIYENTVAGPGDAASPAADPEPGTWDHFQTVMPAYLILWTTWRPHVRR